MKKFVICLFVLSGICLLKLQAQDTLKITLQQALEIALSDNMSVQIADQEIQRQEYAKKGTYASLFPQIDFSGSYGRTLKKQVMYMEMDGQTVAIAVGMDNSWNGGVNAGIPLIAPQLWKSLQISALGVEMAVEQARSSRINMIDQVKQAFYSVLFAKDSYNTFKEAYDFSVSNYKDIKQKYDQGLVSEYDMIQADVAAKNIEPNIYSAESSISLALWQLKALMGLDLDANIDCVGTLADYESQLATLYSNSVSLVNNSSLKQLELQVEQLIKTHELQKAAFLPTLSLGLNYTYITMNNTFKFSEYKWSPYSQAAFSLNIPIFSGGSKKYGIKETEINMKKLSLQYDETERNLKLVAKQSLDQMNTCVKQYDAARSSINQAEKGYDISVKRYEIGDGTMIEVNSSRLQLIQAKLNLSQSIYNYMVSQSALEKTLGNYNSNIQ